MGVRRRDRDIFRIVLTRKWSTSIDSDVTSQTLKLKPFCQATRARACVGERERSRLIGLSTLTSHRDQGMAGLHAMPE